MLNSQASSNNENNNLCQITDYISQEPINIYSLSDIAKYGLPGAGTPNNPFRIENYNITTDDYASIRIVGVREFFLIRNCYLSAQFYGIDIQDILYAGNAIIESNIIVDCSTGIQILSSPNTIIRNNALENNSYSAILIGGSFGTKIEKNICRLSGGGGVKIENSINCSMSDNTFYDGSVFENNESYDDAIFYHNVSTIYAIKTECCVIDILISYCHINTPNEVSLPIFN
jgi:parallel beta-helix repeat protein